MDSAILDKLLADAKSTVPRQSRLMPYREAILVFRARRVSYEAIAVSLRRHGVTIGVTAVGNFVRAHCPRAEVERVRREIQVNPNATNAPRIEGGWQVPLLPVDRSRPARIARDDL